MLNAVSSITVGIVPVLAIIMGLGMVASYFWYIRRRLKTRKTPLARDMFRSPGHSVRLKLEDEISDLFGLGVAITQIPMVILTVYLAQSHFFGVPDSLLRVSFTAAATGGMVLYGLSSCKQRMESIRELRLGMEGEISTGQELDQLMLSGCRVFHDIEMDKGNIDHVVVSPIGVYAVETKTASIPDGYNKDHVIVDTKRRELIYPHKTIPLPDKQCETQRRWLSQFLTSAVGERIEVKSIVALPGWFVELRHPREAVAINPRKSEWYFVRGQEKLSPKLIQQIAHQLEQKCRDVPRSYNEKD